MRILHVTVWPGPPFSGLNINCYNFMKRLAPKFPSRFVIVAGVNSPEDMSREALTALGIPNQGVSLVKHRDISVSDRVYGLLGGDFTPFLSFWERCVGDSLRKTTREIVEEWRPDTMIVWWWAYAAVLARITGVPKVLYACDSLSLANLNSMRQTRNPVRWSYHALMAKRCRRFERTVIPQYDHAIFISRRDAEHAEPPASLPVSIIANGVDTSIAVQSRQRVKDRNVLVFHGYFGFEPNAEALDFLIYSVGKKMESEFGADGFQIRVFGSGVGKKVQGFAAVHRWLKLYGYVEDLHEELASGSIYVAPIAMGAGVKNKVLDAMSCGLPIIGTLEAFSGLDITPGVHCLVCSRDQIPAKVVELLGAGSVRNEMGEAARDWVIKNLDWDIQAARMEEALREVVRPSRSVQCNS